jgi:hypothetical protein
MNRGSVRANRLSASNAEFGSTMRSVEDMAQDEFARCAAVPIQRTLRETESALRTNVQRSVIQRPRANWAPNYHHRRTAATWAIPLTLYVLGAGPIAAEVVDRPLWHSYIESPFLDTEERGAATAAIAAVGLTGSNRRKRGYRWGGNWFAQSKLRCHSCQRTQNRLIPTCHRIGERLSNTRRSFRERIH